MNSILKRERLAGNRNPPLLYAIRIRVFMGERTHPIGNGNVA